MANQENVVNPVDFKTHEKLRAKHIRTLQAMQALSTENEQLREMCGLDPDTPLAPGQSKSPAKPPVPGLPRGVLKKNQASSQSNPALNADSEKVAAMQRRIQALEETVEADRRIEAQLREQLRKRPSSGSISGSVQAARSEVAQSGNQNAAADVVRLQETITMLKAKNDLLVAQINANNDSRSKLKAELSEQVEATEALTAKLHAMGALNVDRMKAELEAARQLAERLQREALKNKKEEAALRTRLTETSHMLKEMAHGEFVAKQRVSECEAGLSAAEDAQREAETGLAQQALALGDAQDEAQRLADRVARLEKEAGAGGGAAGMAADKEELAQLRAERKAQTAKLAAGAAEQARLRRSLMEQTEAARQLQEKLATALGERERMWKTERAANDRADALEARVGEHGFAMARARDEIELQSGEILALREAAAAAAAAAASTRAAEEAAEAAAGGARRSSEAAAEQAAARLAAAELVLAEERAELGKARQDVTDLLATVRRQEGQLDALGRAHSAHLDDHASLKAERSGAEAEHAAGAEAHKRLRLAAADMRAELSCGRCRKLFDRPVTLMPLGEKVCAGCCDAEEGANVLEVDTDSGHNVHNRPVLRPVGGGRAAAAILCGGKWAIPDTTLTALCDCFHKLAPELEHELRSLELV
jgi:chromosome segregation ATPase